MGLPAGDFRAEALEAALGIYRDLGDRLGEGNALRELGAVRFQTGDTGTGRRTSGGR